MIRNKVTLFGVLGLLVLMTGVFTAISADSLGARSAGIGEDGLILVNGDGISESEFSARVAAVEQNVMVLRAQAEMGQDENPMVEEFLRIMEGTPAETIALASLILDVAVYQEAVSRGFQPDPALVAEHVQQERMTFEMIEEDPAQFGIAEEDVQAYREFVDSIGEERYWGEYFPQQIEQQAAVEQFQASVATGGQDWLAVQQSIFQNADVEIQDTDVLFPATVPAAGRYLDTIWNITVQS
jgi:hypothetical protein